MSSDNYNKHRNRLNNKLKELSELSERQFISIKMLIHFLGGKGQAALLVLIGLPFCLPIQIPGLSLPFGLFLAFIGLRIAFGHHVWIPEKILNQEISHATLEKIIDYTTRVTDWLCRFSYTRWICLVQTPALHLLHGLTVALLGFLLALPLPIPLTNILFAVPIVCFGLALLDDDGVVICLAYILSLIAFATFALLFWLGAEGTLHFLH